MSKKTIAEINDPILLQLVREQLTIEHRIAGLEAQLETEQQLLKDVAEKRIPQWMKDNGNMLEITFLFEGEVCKINIKPDVYASVEPEHKEAAYAWVESIGQGGVIKRDIKVRLGLGEERKALEYMKAIEDATGRKAEFEKKIEASTLSAIIRKRVFAGEEVRDDIVKVTYKDAAKITVKGAAQGRAPKTGAAF